MNLPPQYEDPEAAASMAVFRARFGGAGAKVSGGPILNFQSGWAMPLLLVQASTSHWFVRRNDAFARSLCGIESLLELIHGPGNYPRCRNCIRTMSRLIRQGAM